MDLTARALGMTPRSLIIVLAAALVLAGCQTELYRGLTQKDANEMVAVLVRAGIEAKREQVDPTTYSIMVPEEQLAAAVEALQRAGLPRETFRSLGDVFPGDGLIVSPYEQRIRTMFALNQEIGHTLTSIDGVMNARVHIVLPDLDLRGVPMNKPSASVLVHHRPGMDTAELATRIRLLVANGVQGLNFRDVAVAFFPVGGETPQAAAPVGGGQAVPAPAPTPAPPAAQVMRVDAPEEGGSNLPLILWLGAGLLALAAVALAARERLAGLLRPRTDGQA